MSPATKEATRSMPNTIVIPKMNFSNPRLLWKVTPPSLPAPKAPPRPDSDFCRSMTITNIIENIIWSQDRVFSMGIYYQKPLLFANPLGHLAFSGKIWGMESFKGNFLIFVFLLIVGGLSYWAFMGLKANNESLAHDYELTDVAPVVSSDPLSYTPAPIPESEIPVPDNKPEPTKPAVSNPTDADASLIADLQELIDDNVLMKKGSRGTRVGVVQKFLIKYGINMKADNDYGDSTVTAVKKFQTEQKLSADGQTGSGTYKKMIEWLENN